jgi:hypothetical protein
LATIRRDGFGYLSVLRDGNASLTTIPLDLRGGIPIVKINAEGLGTGSLLRVELLDKQGNVMPQYSSVVDHSGLGEVVHWNANAQEIAPGAYRLRIYFEGSQRKQIHFYAAYVN